MSASADLSKGGLDTVSEIRHAPADTPGGKTSGEDISSTRDQSVVYTSQNPFADPEVAAHYARLYEKAKYECRHVFDPTLEWTPQEERRLVRKLDRHVCLWAVSGSAAFSIIKVTKELFSVLCSSPYRLIERIWARRFRTICWTSSV